MGRGGEVEEIEYAAPFLRVAAYVRQEKDEQVYYGFLMVHRVQFVFKDNAFRGNISAVGAKNVFLVQKIVLCLCQI